MFSNLFVLQDNILEKKFMKNEFLLVRFLLAPVLHFSTGRPTNPFSKMEVVKIIAKLSCVSVQSVSGEHLIQFRLNSHLHPQLDDIIEANWVRCIRVYFVLSQTFSCLL